MKRKAVFEHFLLLTLSVLRSPSISPERRISFGYVGNLFSASNMQVGISGLLIGMKDEDMSRRLLFLSVFMMCAAVAEAIDLGYR